MVKIEKVAYKAKGIAFVNDELRMANGERETGIKDKDKNKVEAEASAKAGKVMFVQDAVPGEVCEVRVVKSKRGYLEGKRLRPITPAPGSVTPPCPYFGVCGGCKWQQVPYDTQLEFKEEFITDSLKTIGKIITVSERGDIIPMSTSLGYRNKIELSFGTVAFREQGEYDQAKEEREEGNFLGYHGAGSFYKIVDVEACLLGSPVMNEAIRLVKGFVKKKKLTAYNQKTHEGLMRHLLIREGTNTGELMVNIITNATEDYTEEFWTPLVEDLLMLEQGDTKVESILWTINDSVSDTARGEDIRILHGRDYIFDKIGSYLFKISPYSFFQTNTKGAERLYDLVKEYADLKGGETVVDLYSGTGTIGMYLAKDAKKVFSMESEPSAVADAKVNATMNNIMNVHFIEGKVEHRAHELVFERPDVLIIDPPRAGMHPKALTLLPRFRAPKIIYVSCNPTTLARDLETLSHYYDVKRVQGVDMFPQTYHVETVVELIKKS